MITGHKPRPIDSYYPIDHVVDEHPMGVVLPKDGESFSGIPWGYCEDHSPPFIEVRNAAGAIVRTVNALDCSDIIFSTEQETTCTPRKHRLPATGHY